MTTLHRMKILYGIQATGNGHITRSIEIIEELALESEIESIDVVISGNNADIKFPRIVNYTCKGISFKYGKKGKISYFKSFAKLDLFSFIKSIRSIPFKNYDLVVSDYEPISCWGAKMYDIPCIGIGNIYSLTSKNFPQLRGLKLKTNIVTKILCPTKAKIGMHFTKMDDFVFYPVVRKEIRNAKPVDKDFILVYLLTYADHELMTLFRHEAFKSQKFIVYSKTEKNPYTIDHITVMPLNLETFTQHIIDCSGIITAGGFQTISEALFLHKKLMVIPMKGQPEQKANASILKKMNIPVAKEPDVDILVAWLADKVTNNQHIEMTNDIDKIVHKIIDIGHELVGINNPPYALH